MTVTKPNIANHPRAYKDSIWSVERIGKWILRLIIDGSLVFALLTIVRNYIDVNNGVIYFISLMFLFALSDAMSFILAYSIIKFILGLRNVRVKSFMSTIQYRKRLKKFWIYVFTLMWEVFIFIFSVAMIIANKIPLPDAISYILAWIIIWFSAKALGRLLYFIFYTF